MAADPSSGSLLLFRAAGRCLALPAARVREIDRPRRLTPVPNAPDSLLGLTNLRGAVLPVLSMARLLDQPCRDPLRIIVVDGAKPFGLAVDQVEAVVDTSGDIGESVEHIDIDEMVAARFAELAARPVARGQRVRAARKQRVVSAGVALASFLVADQEFALPLTDVAEVIPLPTDIARLPHADPAVVGTAAWRDRLLPILSLASLLALPDVRTGRERVVVTRIGEHRVGLMVGAMRDVISVESDKLDMLPPILARAESEARITAIARLDGGRRLVSVLAANRLLSDALTDQLRETRGIDDSVQVGIAEESLPIMMFRLGEQQFGLPLEMIDEVRRRPSRLTRLPKAPAFVLGVTNIRGRAVPVIDQGDRFGASASQRRHLIVARSGILQGAFLVDALLGVTRVPASMLTDIPPVGGGEEFGHVVDIEDGGRLALILDPFQLLLGTQQAMLAAFQAGKVSRKP